jgi:RNA polymerase sigma-70 factor (ECF subfamily)
LALAMMTAEEQGFEAALRPLIQPAFRLAFGMLHDRQEAEDAVQEASFKAWNRRSNLRPGSAMRPWYLAIVANQCRSVRRSRWWSVAKVGIPPQRIEFPDNNVVESAEIRAALKRLDHQHRLVLVLHYYLDLPMEQVAQITGDSTEAVKSRIYRAIRKMGPILTAGG